MSIYKRVSGNLVVQTVGNTDSITFQGASANTATVVIDGNLTVTGNASLTGNIAGDKIFNGTTSIEIPAPNGNANVSVGGVSNVFVATTTGVVVTGTASASGNVTGGNINTAGLVSATGNVNGGNLNISSGNINLTRAGTSTTSPTIRFTDSNTAVTSLGSNIGSFEWYASDATGAGPRVTAAVKAVYADGSGNANVLIQTDSGSGLTNRIVVLGATGNVGIANGAPLHGLAVSGTMYGSSTLDIVGNVAGGNVSTAGLITATGNITGGNVLTAGIVSAGGNITGANISVAGGVIGGAGGVSVTGNITGGNLIINGIMSASGNLATTDITATSLSATGNITGGNIKTLGISNVGTSIVTGTQTVTGNITGANINSGGLISASGNINGLNVNTGLVSATGNVVSAPGGYFIGDGGYLSNITVVSNVSVSQLSSGTTNWTIRGAGGNITADIGGTANTVTFYGGGVDITGAFSAVGNVTGANINTGGVVSATGNITGGNVSGTTGTFTTVIGAANATNLTSGIVPSDRLTGQYTIDIVGNAVVANTVATAAQPNITSVGTLTSLTVTGNSSGGNINTGGLVSATGNVRGGNITTPGAVSASGTVFGAGLSIGVGGAQITGNVTGANINTAGLVSATGNVNGGNVNTTNISLSGNVISALNASSSIAAGTTVSAVGNVAGGNITTGGQMSATGNITGSYFIGNGSQLSGIDATSIQNGTSNVRVVSSGGNVAVGIGGTSNVTVFATTGQYVTGLISASGNVTAATFFGSGAGLTAIPGANVTGTVANATFATSASTAGTVTTAAQGNITSVGTLTSLAVTGNITGGNLSVSTGTVTAGNIVNSNANGIGNIGSASVYYNTVFAQATSAQYADLAEKFLADQPYQPGTVLIFGGELEVTESTAYADHRVAGVVSTKPSYLMNAGLEGQYAVELALQGRVPCAVEGPVEKGDLLVSAPNGRARAAKSAQAGTIIGKSLENFSGATGTIEIVVGRD